MKTFIIMLTFISFVAAQQINTGLPIQQANEQSAYTNAQTYVIPFASKGNIIELSVINSSILTTEGVKVEATNAPAWLKLETKVVTLPILKAKEEKVASFCFSVDKSAQVNKPQTLSFSITDKNNGRWTKDIKISIAPPAAYELFQNYPNPFNPTTVLSYQLSAISKVTLKVYDLLGREVANLVNEQEEPGYHQVTFDARHYASGMYIYQLIATDEQNNNHVFRKAMVLAK